MPRLVVLCGPSGSGKSTVLKKLFAEYPNDFGFSVSHTSRKPRQGEEDGVHYHFSNKETMQGMVERGEFVENAVFAGNMYGTSFKAVKNVLSQGKNVILDIDMQGVVQLQAKVSSDPTIFQQKPLFIFLAPPSYEILEQRLKGRGTENDESVQLRLEAAKREMEWGSKPGQVDSYIVNDDLETAYQKLKSAIL
ncbi:P-loop containing nucleoside triphosphate hydrolase protein [Gorgonomyces haynaldii]|nr:P-loop containing nucleoside triphosphate hydrolase protein [Gorgonomyces haynaldii]